MSQGARALSIRRILVALDSSPASMAAMKQAIELAAGFSAEVVGLFVEDINLVHLAESTVTYEVGLFSATRRRLEINVVERQFRGQAYRVQQRLAALAEQAEVRWSFRVVRGVIAKELLNAAPEADLIILGRVGSSLLGRKRLGSTVKAVLRQPPRLMLIFQPSHRPRLPILVLYDGSPQTQKLLAVAAQLSQNTASQLSVMVLVDDLAAAKTLQQEAQEILAAWPELAVRYVWQSRAKPARLLHAVQNEDCGLLVLPGQSAYLDHDAIVTLLAQVEYPVLLAQSFEAAP